MKSSIGPQAPKLLQSTLKIRHDGRQNLGGNHCWSISSSNTRRCRCFDTTPLTILVFHLCTYSPQMSFNNMGCSIHGYMRGKGGWWGHWQFHSFFLNTTLIQLQSLTFPKTNISLGDAQHFHRWGRQHQITFKKIDSFFPFSHSCRNFSRQSQKTQMKMFPYEIHCKVINERNYKSL